MTRVLESKNYDMFELLDFNRDEQTNADLEESMRRYGWMPGFPMIVMHNGRGDRYRIKTGHTRFKVAKKLGIPVKYVVDNTPVSVHELENSTKPWSVNDYLASYCKLDVEDYLEVRDYHQRTGISVTITMSLLAGEVGPAGNQLKKFKRGTYRACQPGRELASSVESVVKEMKCSGVDWATNTKLVAAISRMLCVEAIDISRLKKKIASHTYLIEKQASVNDYTFMLEELYNRQTKDKVPVSFMIDQEMRSRNPRAPWAKD